MKKYDFVKIEKKWQEYWMKNKIYEPDLRNAKKPFYNLMMFPYPSAEGLHVGNMYAFTGSDIYGRFKRMQGYDVFEPMGLDGFGIHSENYALKIGVHPMKQSKISEKRFYRQLEMIGNGFAWDERLETYDPGYYKWTQWIFVQMFKHGLAYRKKSPVNWCPSCKTVLADEQVISGACERCETPVEKREFEQWFFRITKYAEKLLKNLDKIDWSGKVKIAQQNWIGRSEGAEIDFRIKNLELRIKVFTTRPDTLFGATYMVLGPEHPLLKNNELGIKNYEEVKKYIEEAKNKTQEERISEGREKTGVELEGIKAINPVNGKEIPVWVADYVLGDVGTGAIMAVPAHDVRDYEFAKKNNLPIIKVIESPALQNFVRNAEDIAAGASTALRVKGDCYEGEGILVNSGKFNGMDSQKARWAITKFVSGERKVRYHLRDWLISRQRYWGSPIPMVYCEKCNWQPASEKDLPVKLPFIEDFRPQGKGESPLASVKSFYETECPKCGGKARRETDVSDTFLDSAWYYIAYLAKENSKFEIQNLEFRSRAKRWLPVNMYIGGAEHAVLHLLYVRFLALALQDIGVLNFSAKGGSASGGEEPFPKFRAHGLLISEGAKMSKSKGNVVNPDEYIKKFGADTLRMYLMFLAPFEQGGDFRDAAILGVVRFLERVWKLIQNFSPEAEKSENPDLDKLFHRTIKKVTEDIENLHYNTAISALMILSNEMEKSQNSLLITHYSLFLKLLAPFAPHLAEELWSQLGNKTPIHKESWPKYNPKLIEEETFTLVIQINGKVRDQVEVNRGISQKEAEQLVSGRERVKMYLKGQKPKRIIFIPNRLINIVL